MGITMEYSPAVDVSQKVARYDDAQSALNEIKVAEDTVASVFVEELAQIEVIKTQMEKKLAEMLAELNITKTSKEYEAVLKKVRKALYEPMSLLVESKHRDVTGKTYTPIEGYAVTLVESKAKLERNSTLGTTEALEAHKADVALLIEQGMFSSLEIKADEHTLAWMNLRTMNALPTITSVVPVKGGYCKVKLA